MTQRRIEARFAALKAAGRAAFVPYIMAGDPDAQAAWSILRGLPAAGADLIELGMPFSDPIADGPTIQKAAIRALAAGATLEGVFDLVRRFRAEDAQTPIVLMGYLNPLLSRGLDLFARQAAQAGVDGVIVVDCPPEEAGPLAAVVEAQGLDLIRLATPTTDPERLKIVARGTSGFVYYVSVTGVTGTREADAGEIAPMVAKVRAASNLPVAVGFGIRTPERAAAVARVADAAVVGSALVDQIAEAIATHADPVSKVLETAAALSQAVREARG